MTLPVAALPVVGTTNAVFDAAVLACINELRTVLANDIGTVNLGTDINYLDFYQQSWQTVALGGGVTWTPSTLQYYKDPLGIVRIRPIYYTISASVAINTTIATLPAGYRPGSTITQMVIQNGTGTEFRMFSISAAGVVSTLEGQSDSQGLHVGNGTFAFQSMFKAEN